MVLINRRQCLTAMATAGRLRAADSTPATRVSIDAAQVVSRVNPMIFGQFIEQLGRCIYGGIYEEGSPLSDAKGYRRDVLAAARRLSPPVLRWPGGNFASSYHWEDGIGPKAERPVRFDTAWFAREPNRFGTNEFIDYCRLIRTEPYLCINLGTGTMQEAGNWVEYCNSTEDTHYANLRRKHGYREPHKVRYWGLGNEVYGVWQAGHKSAEEYAKAALEAGKIMKWVDPSIQLVAVGATLEWNKTVLDILGPIADYLSVHLYVGGDDYYELLATIKRAEALLESTDAVIEAWDKKRQAARPVGDIGFPLVSRRTQIAFDEWNIWYRRRDGRRRDVKNKIEEPYNLRDALWTASMIHLFQRWGDKVTMANLAQMVNVIAPIRTSPKGLYLQPTFFPLELYRRECGDRVARLNAAGPSFTSKQYGEIPYLDVCATRDERGRLSIGVVNRHQDQALAGEFALDGIAPRAGGKIFTINGPAVDSMNSFEQPHEVTVSTRDFGGFGAKFSLEFPAHSISLVQMQG